VNCHVPDKLSVTGDWKVTPLHPAIAASSIAVVSRVIKVFIAFSLPVELVTTIE
jgi:hypothetical protein